MKNGDSAVILYRKPVKWNLQANWILYFMLVPATVVTILFMYIPMYGVIIAFQDFIPGFGFTGSPWVGLKWFRFVFQMRDFKSIMWNTFIIAVMKMLFLQLVPLFFAIMLNEMRAKFLKRCIQTFTYLPHFFSWVIIGGIFIDLLSINGIVNQFLGVFGVRPIFFLGSNAWFQPTMVITEVWKEFGWGSILYLAAITGVNPELYEAAFLDGAGRFRRIWHITLPGIKSTVVLLFVLNLSNVLNAGFEQILNFYNPAVYATGDILDTFVYRMGLQQAQYSLDTAVGMFKSVIGLVLIISSRYLAYRLADYRVF
jgi:putative aldouronate transport system permease protein